MNSPPVQNNLSQILATHHTEADQKEMWEALALAQLGCTPYPDLRRVSCEMHDEVMTLNGHVPTYYMKQVAQETVRRWLRGGATLVNKLKVDGTKQPSH